MGNQSKSEDLEFTTTSSCQMTGNTQIPIILYIPDKPPISQEKPFSNLGF
jgi:hypothetical protein